MFNKTVCGEAEEHCVDPESGSIPHRTRILKRVLKEKIQYFVLALLWYAFHFQGEEGDELRICSKQEGLLPFGWYFQ